MRQLSLALSAAFALFTVCAFALPSQEKNEKFSKQPTATLKNGKEYVHASGGKFRYPASWRVEDTDEGLRLIPSDGGSDEVILIIAESAEGATDPASPEIVAYLDEQVRSVLPFVRRVGKVEKATAGAGKGVFLVWEGSAEGQVVQVRGYVTIMKNYGVALVAAGPKSTIARRDPQLREIFHTFGWGQGKVDKNLVGQWNHWSWKGNASYGRETRAKVVLSADGTFTYESDTETSASAQGKNSQGQVVWNGGMAGRRGNGWRGTWAADGSNLILNFEDGTSESFSYKFKRESNGTLVLVVTEDGGKPTEWLKG